MSFSAISQYIAFKAIFYISRIFLGIMNLIYLMTLKAENNANGFHRRTQNWMQKIERTQDKVINMIGILHLNLLVTVSQEISSIEIDPNIELIPDDNIEDTKSIPEDITEDTVSIHKSTIEDVCTEELAEYSPSDFSEEQEPQEASLSPPPSRKPCTILSLPNQILHQVFGYINQFDILSIRRVNSRFHKLGAKRQIEALYFYNDDSRGTIILSKYLYTKLFVNFTVLNKLYKFKRVCSLPEFNLVRKIVFYGWSEILHEYYRITSEFPNINVQVDYDTGSPKPLSIQSRYSVSINKGFQLGSIYTNNSVRKLTIDGNGGFTNTILDLISNFKGIESLTILIRSLVDILNVYSVFQCKMRHMLGTDIRYRP